MSKTDEALAANAEYARNFRLGHLPMPPARKLVIVACMDARMDLEPMLGLNPGDAHMLRNAGAIVTEDVLRSLVLSQQLQGTQEVLIISHTDCGMLKFKEEDLRAKLEAQMGPATLAPARFHAFSDLEENVRQQIQNVQSHPWIPKNISVRGFIYDVKSGRLQEVISKPAGASS